MTKLIHGLLPAVATVCLAGFSNAHARETRLPGYECMMLNITGPQSMDPNFHVYLKASPSPASATVGWTPAVVIVKEPAVPVNGFLKIIRPNGKKAWIEARMVKPYHAEADPSAKCAPVVLPNGLIGTGPG